MRNEAKGVRLGNIFWGLFLIMAAVVLIISRFGFLKELSTVSVLLGIFLVVILVDGIIRLSFGKILFSIAFLCIVFDEQLGITAITPWTVLLAALLGTIGLNVLIKKNKHKKNWKKCMYSQNTEAATEGNLKGKNIFFRNSFGEAVKYIVSDDFEFASLECSFGEMKVYFDDVVILGDKATINVDVSFGGAVLYLPKEWYVVNQIKHAFAEVREKDHSNSSRYPEVVITGKVSFGELKIKYI